MSTPAEHELRNIQKRLAAGYDRVVFVASEKTLLGKLERTLTYTLSVESRERVRVLQPEDLVAYLNELGRPKPVEQTVRGYRVKVSYAQVGAADADARKQAISRVLLQRRKSRRM